MSITEILIFFKKSFNCYSFPNNNSKLLYELESFGKNIYLAYLVPYI